MPSPRLLVAALLACSSMGCDSAPGGGKGGPPSVQRYTVRAQVLALPAPKAPRQLGLRHEAIDGFRDASGAVVGMDAMVMPFDVAPEVSLQDVRVGDAIEVVLAMDWARPSLRVEQLRKLPEGTALTFGRARPRPAPGR